MVETADRKVVVRIQTVAVCVRGSVLVCIFSALGSAEVGIVLLIWNRELSSHVCIYIDMAWMLCVERCSESA